VKIVGTNTSQATCTVPTPWAGPFDVTAMYLAGGNYGIGNGQGVANVVAAASSTTIATPTSSPSPAQPGSTLSFTATVGANPADSNDPQPSGTVTWTITPPSGMAPTCTGQGGDTQQIANNGTGTNSTTCSFTLPTNAPTGTYSASARYGSDTNYNASASSTPATINVSKGTPTFGFSTSPASPQVGSPFSVKVTVQGNGSITPQGTVTWTITPPSGGAPTCPPSTLSPSGQGTCQVTPTLAGKYTVTAAYGGNTAYNNASGQTSVVVTLPPAGFDVQTVGNPADNKPDGSATGGDEIVYTYNQAMSASSIMNGWNGSSTNVTATFTRQTGATSLAIQCTGFRCNDPNLGTVTLGDTGVSHYITGSFFGNSVSLAATMTMTTNAGGQSVVTITLMQSSGNFSAVAGNTALTWTPSAAATNIALVPCATTPVTESGSPKANF
jgi:hypothetical protein